ncbi:hypothetical protein [Azoarcus sp. KH32C]|uniref:hypothetical protein n=1 Tax=Azoarcus sp. KH32C TaxID=748247 RepID=UPI0002386B47|nr:hypothetical protein [Azoarcus sp. KH32C]BAL23834.1 hypothetical protein AZKH_1513 [Azoarcus sp. KH32C]
MNTTAQNLAVLAAMLGLCVSSAYAASAPDQGGSARISGVTVESPLARKGADDPPPAPGCDDHGTDLCQSELAKNGADDPMPQPGCDDHGTDLCLTPTAIET